MTVCEHGHNYFPAVLVYDLGSSQIDTWTHVALVYEDREPRLYLDGHLVKVGQRGTRPLVHAFTDRIGGMAFGYFHGKLDEVRIYNHALSAKSVEACYVQVQPPARALRRLNRAIAWPRTSRF